MSTKSPPKFVNKLVDEAVDRVSFLHGREATDSPHVSEHIGHIRDSLGINVRPGPDDDGWEQPPRVTLDDGAELQLYKDGEAALAAYRAIMRAKRRVLLEIYIWPSDETGRKFAELLIEKARAGVAVFIIYDGFGSLLADKTMFAEMRRAGCQVVEFHPALPQRSRWGWRLFNRDHRKLLVVDDNTVGVGGLNVGNRYAGNWVASEAHVKPEKMWRDAGVGIRCKGAADRYARAFAKTWHYCLRRGPIGRTSVFTGLALPERAVSRIGKVQLAYNGFRPLDGRTPTDLLEPEVDVGCVGSAPAFNSPLRPFLYRLVRDARKSLSLTMAYFAPDDELIEGLCAAARRGVKVRLMMAGRSDARILIVAARAFYRRLMDAGAQVYERQGAMLHQKTIVADGELSVLGSTNLDYRSIEFNLELSGRHPQPGVRAATRRNVRPRRAVRPPHRPRFLATAPLPRPPRAVVC